MLFYIKDIDASGTVDSAVLECLRNIILKVRDKDEGLNLHMYSNKQILNRRSIRTLINHAIEIYRCYQLHKNEQETIVSPNHQIVIVQIILHQLHMEQKSLSVIRDLQSNIIKRKLDEIGITDNNMPVNENMNHVLKENDLNTEFDNIFVAYESFLCHSNMVDWVDIVRIIIEECNVDNELSNRLYNLSHHMVLIGGIESPVERKLFEILKIENVKIYDVTISVSLNASFNKELLPEHLNIEINEITFEELKVKLFEQGHISDVPFNSPNRTPSTNSISSASELYAGQLILSYLELLVNSRNELSLATVINVPDRDIDHASFTHIKHEAAKRRLSMYQTILSFITRIRLGGKGYAPPPDNPLSNHVKGLSEFTDVVNKLHSILEEDLSMKSATTRIVNTIKNCLLKPSISSMKSAVLKKSILDKAASNILSSFEDQFKKMDVTNADDITPTRGIGEGASLNGRRTLRLIRNVLDFYSSLYHHHSDDDNDDGIIITDTVLTQAMNTPIRIVPSLASKFRTPDETESVVHKKRKLQDKTNQICMIEEEKEFKLNSRLKKHITTLAELDHKPSNDASLQRVHSLPADTKPNNEKDSLKTTTAKECMPSKKLKLDDLKKKKVPTATLR